MDHNSAGQGRGPLAYRGYRALWLIGLGRNFGTWMHNMAAAAALATLSPSPLVNSLLYATTMVPIFFFSFPAGLFADRFGRGFILFWSSAVSILAAAGFLALDLTGGLTVGWLLGLTFAINTSWAVTYPAWNAEVSAALPRELVKDGASLNSLSYNLARTMGPAIAGFVYSGFGGAPVYLLNALSFVGLLAYFFGHRSTDRSAGATLTVPDAFRQTIALVRESVLFRAVLIRGFLYFFVGQTIWSMLPVYVMRERGLSESQMGFASASAGVGAIAMALLYPRLRRRYEDNWILLGAGVITAACTAVLPALTTVPQMAVPLAVYGAVYAVAVTINNGLIQVHVPIDMRARAVGLYVVVLYGVQSAGSVVAGWLAGLWGYGWAFGGLGAALLCCSVLGVLRWPVTEPQVTHQVRS
ncbi:Transmembrane secretion effector [Amycolatopsis xylanica]|uniref:Transmembrane secretion effector n=1 Tax=Amycolatopsis xylanica TaxID=589385 RepID=A0A1H3EVU3_9PSEU|nr:Transmembrane secretion effector [Amycolatopsis xylanica]